jgi:hypothetical protein
MNKKFRKFIPLLILLFTGFLVLAIWVIMLLWNHVLTAAVSGIHVISFWQAAGLFLLSKLLFGGFKKSWRKDYCGEKRNNKWFNMSDEEKEKFKAQWRSKWCKPTEQQQQTEAE